jgi:lipoprotein-releasing system ATP-binding protein
MSKPQKIILELKNICKDYAQGGNVTEVLKDFSLKLHSGEVIAIVGASGCGKSTLLHIAGLLDKPDGGEIIIDGKVVQKNSRNKHQIRLKNIGFIYQHHHLLKDFSARENVALPFLIAGKNYDEALERADKFLESFDLENRSHNFPGELSGGQQQRVAIARALMNQPKIILADEPTGNLDADSAKNVMNILIRNAKENSIGTIIVTHNEKLAKMADRMIKLGGK